MDILNPILLSPPFTFDGDASQSGALVGTWSNVTHLSASEPKHHLTAKHQRTELEARDANDN